MTPSMIATLGLTAALLIAACSSNTGGGSATAQTPTSSTGELAMTLAFSPSPPKQGSETITISLKDASGNAVKGATVHISTKMPDMSMTGPTMTALDNGDGTYSAVANMNYQTKWLFDVTASNAGKSSTASFTVDVK